ncbi:MAG TPA: pseudouridine synthase [Acidimicrobiia bacterium]|nr:pseudouridine synthase [Acidimicrobiia bacterium]
MTPAPKERLQKAISAAGLMSRRAAEELISAGRVTVNGRVARLGDRVDAAVDRVEVDGIPMPVAPEHVTYLLYKPPGVVSTASDPEGRPTVVELVPSSPRVVPVGRLDYESEGLLLLTNDGDLVNAVTHPRFGVTKTYLVEVAGQPGPAALRQLRSGIELEDGVARAVAARMVARSPQRAQLELVMGEGRNREVRRMLDALGYPVLKLVRVAIGPLRDQALRPGSWRQLHNNEVRKLYMAAGERGAKDSTVS